VLYYTASDNETHSTCQLGSQGVGAYDPLLSAHDWIRVETLGHEVHFTISDHWTVFSTFLLGRYEVYLVARVVCILLFSCVLVLLLCPSSTLPCLIKTARTRLALVLLVIWGCICISDFLAHLPRLHAFVGNAFDAHEGYFLSFPAPIYYELSALITISGALSAPLFILVPMQREKFFLI